MQVTRYGRYCERLIFCPGPHSQIPSQTEAELQENLGRIARSGTANFVKDRDLQRRHDMPGLSLHGFNAGSDCYTSPCLNLPHYGNSSVAQLPRVLRAVDRVYPVVLDVGFGSMLRTACDVKVRNRDGKSEKKSQKSQETTGRSQESWGRRVRTQVNQGAEEISMQRGPGVRKYEVCSKGFHTCSNVSMFALQQATFTCPLQWCVGHGEAANHRAPWLGYNAYDAGHHVK